MVPPAADFVLLSYWPYSKVLGASFGHRVKVLGFEAAVQYSAVVQYPAAGAVKPISWWIYGGLWTSLSGRVPPREKKYFHHKMICEGGETPIHIYR